MLCILTTACAVEPPTTTEITDLPVLPDTNAATLPRDWLQLSLLEAATAYRANVYRSTDSREIHLDNGLVRRTFRVSPNAATVSLRQLGLRPHEVLRGVKPEAQVTFQGKNYDIGGLLGQPNYAYLLPEWLENMSSDPQAFRYVEFAIGPPAARFAWKQVRHHASQVAWPPPGKHLRLDFVAPETPTESPCRGIRVSIHYELYDGVPVFCKWMEVSNHSTETITLEKFSIEQLAVVEHSSWVESADSVPFEVPAEIHVESDFAFGGFDVEHARRHVVHWRPDPQYETQVNYLRKQPCLLVVGPEVGPAQDISAGRTFTTCRAFELLHDRSDREGRGLALRRMYRIIAPWVTENPLMHHMTQADIPAVHQAIDQAKLAGFEMIILSFGSGFNTESTDSKYRAAWREVADHAHAQGIELGSYSLYSSRSVGNGDDIVSPPGQSPAHGHCPALTSAWGQNYLKNLKSFFDSTQFNVLEHDGPYAGDIDITARPPLQKGALDSQWAHWRLTTDFYQHCRSQGIYLNTPDFYYLAGSNKCGMGYREVNWSLPRDMQLIHTRQNIYDGTWQKTPSMGWMFVPLSEYHGGGAAATIEPLHAHRDHYAQIMLSNLAYGVQACYRGPRLFDTPETLAVVQRNVAWFKEYREVLESDIVHGRRADGRSLDWVLHVNPGQHPCGMLVVFNPSSHPQRETLPVNLYYTGLTQSVQITSSTASAQSYPMDRQSSISLTVEVAPHAMQWYVMEGREPR